MSAEEGKAEGSVWYFAYGSNMKLSVMEQRGLRPKAARPVVVPSHVLTFDVFGVPYSEPAMASIAPRPVVATGRCTAPTPTAPPVHGVAYLLSAADFRTLTISEGAGIAYVQVQLDARLLPPAFTGDTTATAQPLLAVRTLSARFPFRPNPRPSARYLSLLVDGAKEHHLPEDYRAYLEALPCYFGPSNSHDSRFGTWGTRCFLAFWMMLLSDLMRRIKASASASGRAPPAHHGYLVALLFRFMWCYHDWVHSRIWGDGGRHSSLQARTERLLAEIPLIDGHNDFAYMVRGWYQNRLDRADFRIDDMPIGQTDLKRLRKGKLGGQFWSAFVPSPKDGQGSAEALRDTTQQVDLLHALFSRFPAVFGFVDRAADILPVFRSGRLVSLIGIEGLHSLGGSFSALRMFHRLGVRYATLCHSKTNEFTDSATSESVHGGLSDLGARVIMEMNRIGMIVDLSHTSHEAQIAALGLSRAPVIFSHSSSYALCPNERNVKDEALMLLKANDGLIMICFIPDLLGTDQGPATVQSAVDHIMYVGDMIGYAHVAIGSDFDGMLKGPADLDDVSCYPNLVAEMLRRGMSESDVGMVMGLNVVRLLEDVEKVSRTAQYVDIWVQACDDIPGPWTEEQKALLKATGKERGLKG